MAINVGLTIQCKLAQIQKNTEFITENPHELKQIFTEQTLVRNDLSVWIFPRDYV